MYRKYTSKEKAMLFRPMGIDGLAVVSAVVAQPDIKRAAATLKYYLRQHLRVSRNS